MSYKIKRKKNSNSPIMKGTDANFDSVVVASDVPVLVDFWAPWCGPCRAVAPVLEELAAEYKGKVKIVKVNVDEETAVAGSMGVKSIPTIALFNHGEVKNMVVGAQSKQAFSAMLDSAIGN